MNRTRSFIACAALAGLLSLGASLPAAAHAYLEKADPSVGGTVADGPIEVRLTFSEPVEAKLSSIQLTRADGSAVASGAAADPADPKGLVLKLGKALANGVYKVRWKVISVDSHKIEGGFSFTVGN